MFGVATHDVHEEIGRSSELPDAARLWKLAEMLTKTLERLADVQPELHPDHGLESETERARVDLRVATEDDPVPLEAPHALQTG